MEDMCLFLFFFLYIFGARYSFIFVAHRNQNSFKYENKNHAYWDPDKQKDRNTLNYLQTYRNFIWVV